MLVLQGMKTTRVLLALFSAMAAVIIASAQTVDFIVVAKQHSYNQVDNTSVVDATNPWQFHANVEGTGLSGSTPSITLAAGSVGGSTTYTYDSGDDAWNIDAAFATSGALNTAYANGNYSITMLSQTVTPISLTGDTYPIAPIASLSGGTISAGVLNWNPNTALTITISGTGIDHMGVFVFGTGYNGGDEGFGVTTKSFTVPAFSMTVGQTYTVELSFDDVVGSTAPFNVSGTGGMSAAQYAGVYTAQTKFTINAIPEPATYAAIFGALALAGSIVHRRRRQAV